MPTLHYAATAQLFLPLLLCLAYTVGVEQVLYRRDYLFMPLWRPAVMIVVMGVAMLVWNSWAHMVPMESVLLYGGTDKTSLIVSVFLFVGLVFLVLVGLFWGSVSRMFEDRLHGASSIGILLLRLSTLVPPIFALANLLVRANAMVGRDGFLALAFE